MNTIRFNVNMMGYNVGDVVEMKDESLASRLVDSGAATSVDIPKIKPSGTGSSSPKKKEPQPEPEEDVPSEPKSSNSKPDSKTKPDVDSTSAKIKPSNLPEDDLIEPVED